MTSSKKSKVIVEKRFFKGKMTATFGNNSEENLCYGETLLARKIIRQK